MDSNALWNLAGNEKAKQLIIYSCMGLFCSVVSFLALMEPDAKKPKSASKQKKRQNSLRTQSSPKNGYTQKKQDESLSTKRSWFWNLFTNPLSLKTPSQRRRETQRVVHAKEAHRVNLKSEEIIAVIPKQPKELSNSSESAETNNSISKEISNPEEAISLEYLQETVNNLQSELDKSKSIVINLRQAKSLLERQLKAESRLRNEAEETVRMLRMESEKQIKYLELQLQTERAKSKLPSNVA